MNFKLLIPIAGCLIAIKWCLYRQSLVKDKKDEFMNDYEDWTGGIVVIGIVIFCLLIALAVT